MEKKPFTLLLILAIVMLFGMPVLIWAWPVPDTGQTKCYDNAQEIPCPQPGEPFYGQDAQYGPNLQLFIASDYGTVFDSVSGLEWQRASPPGPPDPPGMYRWPDAVTYCNNLYLGGNSGWRLPTVKELSFLVDCTVPLTSGPMINTAYFPDTLTHDYWTNTDYYSDSVWMVNFYYGALGNRIKTAYYGRYIRAVRGGQFDNSFIDNGDGTITDTSTGLMWQKATAPDTYTWQQALAYCENLTLAGHSDWRLPNRNELQSIVDYSKSPSTIDTTYFPDTWTSCLMSAEYWSSSTVAGYPDFARLFNFCNGHVGNQYKTAANYHVRAVRGGQGGPSTSSTSSSTTTSAEPSTSTSTTIAIDSDGDGFLDPQDNCPSVCNPQQLDADTDGIGDVCDASSGCGGCGQAQCEQECPPPTTSTTTTSIPDTDSDGFLDNVDNCPTICNTQQLDADIDGIGDVCDDPNNDGCGGCGQPLCETPC